MKVKMFDKRYKVVNALFILGTIDLFGQVRLVTLVVTKHNTIWRLIEYNKIGLGDQNWGSDVRGENHCFKQ